jgi:hypothetical protein
MKPVFAAGLALLSACASNQPADRYGFIALLGRDTISLESVARRGDKVIVDGVDRFPRVRQRHTEIELAQDGTIRHLTMDVSTPSEPADQRERHIDARVTKDSLIMEKRDAKALRWAFATNGKMTMPHVPQMYSLYELYFAAALKSAAANKNNTVQMRQFYIDREFDRFSLQNGEVRRLPDGRVWIEHDWLSGIGEATVDSSYRLQHYSGARTTYQVEVRRLADAPDVQSVGKRLAAAETAGGGAKQLSTRDTARATIGSATFSIDYGRPLARGRVLVGNVIPYDQVWRTGANAATQFTTSAPITLAGISMAPGTYTLWTLPAAKGVQLIVNKQSGQWGTDYDVAQDLARAPMTSDSLAAPVEQFTIGVAASDDHHGTLKMEWGPFRWSAPIVLRGTGDRH